MKRFLYAFVTFYFLSYTR